MYTSCSMALPLSGTTQKRGSIPQIMMGLLFNKLLNASLTHF